MDQRLNRFTPNWNFFSLKQGEDGYLDYQYGITD
nr:MAG TPA: hypothetical protein [Caudoviricetes sp.]